MNNKKENIKIVKQKYPDAKLYKYYNSYYITCNRDSLLPATIASGISPESTWRTAAEYINNIRNS